MPNIYTVTQVTTTPIDASAGLLDDGGVFPPDSGYRLVINSDLGADIAANQFRVGMSSIPMEVNPQGNSNSNTDWPSTMEWIYTDIDTLDPNTLSGYFEFPAFYKVVFRDSENLNNDPNYLGSSTNQVYVWIYFGKNRTTPIASLVDLAVALDIDFDPDPITLSESLPLSTTGNTGTITSFTI